MMQQAALDFDAPRISCLYCWHADDRVSFCQLDASPIAVFVFRQCSQRTERISDKQIMARSLAGWQSALLESGHGDEPRNQNPKRRPAGCGREA